jgi:hypothetical protein
MNVQRVRRRNLVLLAADAYREADAWLTATLDEWDNEEEYTSEQYAHVCRWYMWAIEAEAKALGRLMDVAKERG